MTKSILVAFAAMIILSCAPPTDAQAYPLSKERQRQIKDMQRRMDARAASHRREMEAKGIIKRRKGDPCKFCTAEKNN